MNEKYKVKIKGVSPLLMHRFAETESTHKIKKSGQEYDSDVDAKAALYTDGNGTVVQPSTHIESAMIKAATNYKIPGQGKKTFKDAFKGGIIIDPLQIPHKNQKWVKDMQSVVINRSRIVRARPRLDDWELEFTIINSDERVTPNIIKDTLSDAGKFFGIGDFRPKFGRFEITEFKKAK